MRCNAVYSPSIEANDDSYHMPVCIGISKSFSSILGSYQRYQEKCHQSVQSTFNVIAASTELNQTKPAHMIQLGWHGMVIIVTAHQSASINNSTLDNTH